MPPVTLRLDHDLLKKLSARRGWTRQSDMCRALGLSVATVSRMHSDGQAPGARVIAALLREFGPKETLRLLHVVPVGGDQERAA